ncbi:Phenylalanine--tRNA ligase beta subunit [Pelotomaculum sp. FP]|uniref:phenylalanine--tRNA ligase subunit beta n=1 Tax=Pelotomaculum sp. FP TaxID=261474 RepID=UPI001065BA0B|nr:phenylalanine--tRNA ligase subunit beta [Pelotomaculum sp. FP]TEB14280.1 Phenylalanine--tRNA ligase beta subunit [Pelotomaculum sp. FP]
MRVSYKWLQEFVEIDITPQELADRLTLAGVTVEGVTELGVGISNVITGRIESISPHPNADKLVVTSVDTGGEKRQIITAATNVREGDVIPVAVEGARLASGLVIKKAKLRGVESRGMMCSGQELGIDPKTMVAEQANGIMILPPGTPLGQDAKEILGLDDHILELDLTPNRGDCLSMIGVAREVAALLGRPLRLPQSSFKELPESIEGQARVDIEDTDLCRRFCARLVKNVKVGPSPLWMQQRLRNAGIRPISNIVDVTNYVMLELGQPMHAFDYNLLKDGHIIVRRGRAGEKMLSLDGNERVLTPDMLAITDPSGPVGIAGVMGGLATEVTAKTVSVLLESAFFNPISIRKTSKALGLRSEASQRFEKGIDIGGSARAANRAAQLITEMEAGDVVSGIIDVCPEPLQEKIISLRPGRATYILGVEVPKEEAAGILTGLQFKVRESGADLLVTVPTHRVDVNLEIDLIEEIARMHGYDRVPGTLPYGQSIQGKQTREQSLTAGIRNSLAGDGLYEVMTYSFTHPRVLDQMNLPADSPFREMVKLQNPLSEEHSVMRTMMLPGLLETLARNFSRRVQNGAVFEIGRVFYPREEGSLPEERQVLSAAAMGRTMAGWNAPARELDFYHLKGVLENLFDYLRTEPVNFQPELENPSFHPGRSAWLEAGGTRLGVVGELHPDVLEQFGLPDRVVAFELDLEQLLKVSGRPFVYTTLPRFPAVERDIAVLIKQGTPAAQVVEAIRRAGGELLRSVFLFDVYRGGQVPQGYQSMAFSLRFYAEDRTLTDTEVAERTAAIANSLAQGFGAELRA